MRVYAYTYMYDCLVTQSLSASPYVPFGHADVSPWPSAAQRPYVYLMKTYVPYVFRAKRQARTSNLLSFCPSVLMSPVLAASDSRYGVSPYVS